LRSVHSIRNIPYPMVIALASHKGGTGKTTTTLNLGCALARLNKKILLLDLDPQGNLSYSLGIPDTSPSISEVFTGEYKLEEILVQREGMHVAAASMSLADIELSLQPIPNRTNVLREIIEPVRSAYDFILIDCPPSRSLLSVNALTAANYAVIPVLLDVLSIQGLQQVSKTITEIQQTFNKELKILGVLAVNVDTRKKVTWEVFEFIKKHFPVYAFASFIRTNVKLIEAPSHGQTIYAYAPDSKTTIEYDNLAVEFLKRVNFN
jgi:chromosome partitioning protein